MPLIINLIFFTSNKKLNIIPTSNFEISEETESTLHDLYIRHFLYLIERIKVNNLSFISSSIVITEKGSSRKLFNNSQLVVEDIEPDKLISLSDIYIGPILERSYKNYKNLLIGYNNRFEETFAPFWFFEGAITNIEEIVKKPVIVNKTESSPKLEKNKLGKTQLTSLSNNINLNLDLNLSIDKSQVIKETQILTLVFLFLKNKATLINFINLSYFNLINFNNLINNNMFFNLLLNINILNFNLMLFCCLFKMSLTWLYNLKTLLLLNNNGFEKRVVNDYVFWMDIMK